MDNIIEELKNKMMKFQDIYDKIFQREKEGEHCRGKFEIRGDSKQQKYDIYLEEKIVLSLSIEDLNLLEKATGEEPFIRYYFYNDKNTCDKNVWEYFQDKNISNKDSQYKKEIINSLMSYAFIERCEEEKTPKIKTKIIKYYDYLDIHNWLINRHPEYKEEIEVELFRVIDRENVSSTLEFINRYLNLESLSFYFQEEEIWIEEIIADLNKLLQEDDKDGFEIHFKE